MKNSIFKNLATLGPIGYLTASGTRASLLTIIVSLLINKFIPNPYLQLALICLFTLLSYQIINACRSQFSCKDPRQIVLDEVVGSLFAFYHLSGNPIIYFWAFIIFRFLDITKLFGISYLEKNCPGALGILIDDIVAGILTSIIIHFIIM